MKNSIVFVAAMAMVFLTSCAAIGGIFKAGVGFGIFIVVVIVLVVAWVLFRNKK